MIFQKEKIGTRRIIRIFGKKVLSYTRGGESRFKKIFKRISSHSIKSRLKTLDEKISRIDAKTEIAFQSAFSALHRHPKSYSQLGADLVAYALHNGKKDGFYVDIGAHNGVEISNTLLFENLGWEGFCVEANPKTFEALRKNRKCDCYNLAVFSKNVGALKMATTSASALDSLEVNLTENHRKRMQYEGGRDEKLRFVEVQSASFGEIMAHYPRVTHIDFMSLDIEGGELEVLKGIDFEKYTFSLMAIEHNGVKSAIDGITALLESKGYKVLFFNAWDFLFVPDDRLGCKRGYELKL